MRKIAVSLLLAVVFAGVASAQLQGGPLATPNAQEQIERTLGQLFVLNAQAQAQIAAQAQQIAELQKQLKAAQQVSEPKAPADANDTPAKPTQAPHKQ